MKLILRMIVGLLLATLLLALAAPAQAAKPCNQHPTFIQPITCKILERLP